MEWLLAHWWQVSTGLASVLAFFRRRSIGRMIDSIADLTTATLKLEACQARHRAKDLTIADLTRENAVLMDRIAHREATSLPADSGDSSAGSSNGAANPSPPSKTSPTTP
jgi:hypothetical protein